MQTRNKSIRILGTRGVPAAHGGFETFAEHLALYLVRRGWQVTVYCQQDGSSAVHEDTWEGVHRIHIPVTQSGARGTIVFDWKSTLHAAREPGLVLTLGYNTAIFCAIYRLKGITNLINMDGIEWRREKWTWLERTWLYLNERAGSLLGNHLIADHPEIKSHLMLHAPDSKITMIPYGADQVESADVSCLDAYGLAPDKYAILIARPEPENSILEVVKAFSAKHRNMKLVVLGKYSPDEFPYHKLVMNAASSEVLFPGAIYEKPIIQSLRFHARLYIHGHKVGGTNPSLVEALGAGSAVLAQDNKFNLWVAGTGARYFSDERNCITELDAILMDDNIINNMKQASLGRFLERLTWDKVLSEYESLLLHWVH